MVRHLEKEKVQIDGVIWNFMQDSHQTFETGWQVKIKISAKRAKNSARKSNFECISLKMCYSSNFFGN
jgi:hypothetical protein